MIKTNSEKGKYTRPGGSATLEYFATVCCSSMIFCIGCMYGWSAPTLILLLGPEKPFEFAESDVSMTIISYCLGFSIAPAFNPMADKIGRKNSLLAISVPMILNWGLIAVAKGTMALFVARFLAGLCAALGICVIPTYLGEIASVKLRGTLTMIICTMGNIGTLCAFLWGPYVSMRTSACINLAISIVSAISLWFIPESPYFLAMIGRMDEAEDTLERLRGKPDVSEEMDIISKSVSQQFKAGETSKEVPRKFNAFKQLISVSGNRRAFYINLLFIFVLQFGSYVTLMSMGHLILDAMRAGVPASTSAIIMAALQLVFNILTTFVIDKIGRRPLVWFSGVISGACLLVISVYFYLMEYKHFEVTPYGFLPLIAMLLNVSALSIGIMPVQIVIRSETLATEVKALVNALVGVLGGVMSIFSGVLYVMAVSTWNFGHTVLFIGYAIVTWSSTVAILKLLPETKGKTFVEIQAELNAS